MGARSDYLPMTRIFRGPFPRAVVFHELSPAVLRDLAPFGRVFQFEPGELVVEQGRPNEWLHVIMVGQVSLERKDEAGTHPFLIEQHGPGELLGEYGLVDQRRTPYTARAITKVQTLRFQHLAIAHTMYYQARDQVPTFQAALRRRIREATLREAVLSRREGVHLGEMYVSSEPFGNEAAPRD
jgi:CRP-like cAMP-binding protein